MIREAVLTKSANNKDVLKLWKSRKKHPAELYKVSKYEVRVKTIFVFPFVVLNNSFCHKTITHTLR